MRINKIFKNSGIIFFLICFLLAFYVGKYGVPTWTSEQMSLDVHKNAENQLSYVFEDTQIEIPMIHLIKAKDAYLTKEQIQLLNQEGKSPKITQEYTYEIVTENGEVKTLYYLNKARKHWRIWSF